MTDELARRVAGLLEAESIPYALIGAYAVLRHGVTRATMDVDFCGKDAWDITQLLATVDQSVIAEVEERLPDLQQDARDLWQRIRRGV